MSYKGRVVRLHWKAQPCRGASAGALTPPDDLNNRFRAHAGRNIPRNHPGPQTRLNGDRRQAAAKSNWVRDGLHSHPSVNSTEKSLRCGRNSGAAGFEDGFLAGPDSIKG